MKAIEIAHNIVEHLCDVGDTGVHDTLCHTIASAIHFASRQHQEEVRQILTNIQWSGGVANPFNNGWCPECEAPSEFKMETSQHEPDCKLAALLVKCGGLARIRSSNDDKRGDSGLTFTRV